MHVFRVGVGSLPALDVNLPGDYMSLDDKTALRDLSRGFCIEIGTLYGGSATGILMGKADHLLCIDTFRGSAHDMYGLVSPDLALSVVNMRLDAFDHKRWSIWQNTSVNAASLLKDDVADMIFIDGDHSEQGVAIDIGIWWPKLKDGGIMCGHDYDCEPGDDDKGGLLHPSVAKVIYSVFGKDKIRKMGSCIWSVTKERHS